MYQFNSLIWALIESYRINLYSCDNNRFFSSGETEKELEFFQRYFFSVVSLNQILFIFQLKLSEVGDQDIA